MGCWPGPSTLSRPMAEKFPTSVYATFVFICTRQYLPRCDESSTAPRRMMLVLVKDESLLQKAKSDTFLCVSFFKERIEGRYCSSMYIQFIQILFCESFPLIDIAEMYYSKT